MNRVHAHAVCTHLQEIMNKVHFLPSSVKDKDEAIAWCAVSTSLLLPHTPMTDTLLPAQVQSPGCASLLTLARGESGNACAIVQESQAKVAVGAGKGQRLPTGLAHAGCSATFGFGKRGGRREGWTAYGARNQHGLVHLHCLYFYQSFVYFFHFVCAFFCVGPTPRAQFFVPLLPILYLCRAHVPRRASRTMSRTNIETQTATYSPSY